MSGFLVVLDHSVLGWFEAADFQSIQGRDVQLKSFQRLLFNRPLPSAGPVARASKKEENGKRGNRCGEEKRTMVEVG